MFTSPLAAPVTIAFATPSGLVFGS
jgi:hypothetical protein